MLRQDARVGAGDVDGGATPEAKRFRDTPLRPHVVVFLGERVLHVAAELGTELEREQAKQRAIRALDPGARAGAASAGLRVATPRA